MGLFLLNEIKQKIKDIDFGLYRDDGIASHRRLSGPRLDQIHKELHQIFKEHGLRITIEPPNLTRSNFLDVTMDLEQENYAPYRKPNDRPLYVHRESNHPPNILREIPKSINKRLSSISSSATEFNTAKADYQQALNVSGYTHQLE